MWTDALAAASAGSYRAAPPLQLLAAKPAPAVSAASLAPAVAPPFAPAAAPPVSAASARPQATTRSAAVGAAGHSQRSPSPPAADDPRARLDAVDRALDALDERVIAPHTSRQARRAVERQRDWTAAVYSPLRTSLQAQTTSRFGVVDSESAAAAVLRSHRELDAEAGGPARSTAAELTAAAPASKGAGRTGSIPSMPGSAAGGAARAVTASVITGAGGRAAAAAPAPAAVTGAARVALERADPTRSILTRVEREKAAVGETMYAPLLRASGAAVAPDGRYAFVVRPGETSAGTVAGAAASKSSLIFPHRMTAAGSLPPTSPARSLALSMGGTVQHGIATYVLGDPTHELPAAVRERFGARAPSARSLGGHGGSGLLISDGMSRPVLNPKAWSTGVIEDTTFAKDWHIVGDGVLHPDHPAIRQYAEEAMRKADAAKRRLAGAGDGRLPPEELAGVLLEESAGWGPGFRGKKRVAAPATLSKKPADSDSVIRRRTGPMPMEPGLAAKLMSRDTRLTLQPETEETRAAPPPPAYRPGMRVVRENPHLTADHVAESLAELTRLHATAAPQREDIIGRQSPPRRAAWASLDMTGHTTAVAQVAAAKTAGAASDYSHAGGKAITAATRASHAARGRMPWGTVGDSMPDFRSSKRIVGGSPPRDVAGAPTGLALGGGRDCSVVLGSDRGDWSSTMRVASAATTDERAVRALAGAVPAGRGGGGTVVTEFGTGGKRRVSPTHRDGTGSSGVLGDPLAPSTAADRTAATGMFGGKRLVPDASAARSGGAAQAVGGGGGGGTGGGAAAAAAAAAAIAARVAALGVA